MSVTAERLELAVDGMTCASCAARIERKLNKLDGVSATVNYATEKATVEFDPALVTPSILLETVETVGYHAHLPQTEAAVASERDPADALRVRLTVAAIL